MGTHGDEMELNSRTKLLKPTQAQSPNTENHNSKAGNEEIENNPDPPTSSLYNKEEQGKLLDAAKSNKWELVSLILQNYSFTYQFITEAIIDTHTNRSILHHACDQDRNESAAKAVKRMLEPQEFTAENAWEARREFMDREDKDGNVALQLAAMKKNRQVVRILLRMGADLNKPEKQTIWFWQNKTKGKNESEKNKCFCLWSTNNEAIQYIYKNMADVIAEQLDENWTLTKDKQDPSEDMYDVEWDFTPVIGVLQQDNYDSQRKQTSKKSDLEKNKARTPPKKFECQTKLLTCALQQNEGKRSKVLNHALVQLFLHYKHDKFKWLIRSSMVYHIFWSILSIWFMVQHSHFPVAGPVSNNSSNTSVPFDCKSHCYCNGETVEPGDPPTMKDTSAEGTTPNWISILTLVFWALAVVKEFIEIYTCPNIWFYIWQLENIGQIILILFLPATWISTFYANDDLVNFFATTGTLIAGLLILGQLNKIKSLGIYMEMMVTVVWNLLKFLFFFCPLLGIFGLLFRSMLPNNDVFWSPYIVKLSAMMTGELNYDEVFHNPEKDVPFPILTKIVFLFFVLLVVIVLQNLLIGLTLSDIQDLKKKSTESHVAKQLEHIFLIEYFLLLPRVQWTLKIVFKLERLMVDPIGPTNDNGRRKKLGELDDVAQEIILTAIEAGKKKVQLPDVPCENDEDEEQCDHWTYFLI